MKLSGVLVTPDLVGSSGFRAWVGAVLPLALEIHPWQPGHHGAESELTGVAVPFERDCPLGGWVLEVAGVAFHVTEASDRDPGSVARVRGAVSVADGYLVDELERALGRSVERHWRVERIVRLAPARPGQGGGGDPAYR